MPIFYEQLDSIGFKAEESRVYFRIYSILFLLLSFLIPACQQVHGRACDTLYSYPNVIIPSEEGSTLIDIINFPTDILISDLDFYIDMATFGDLPGELIISVSAPWGKEVTLHNHNKERQFPCWIGSQNGADDAGSLDDFVGHNARGLWVMYMIRYAGYYPFTWESWAIAVDGEPLAEAENDNDSLVTGLNPSLSNPFCSRTTINFTVDKPDDISFVIYNTLGQVVREFEPLPYQTGHHRQPWDGMDSANQPLPSGYYFVKMTVGQMQHRRVFASKVVLLR